MKWLFSCLTLVSVVLSNIIEPLPVYIALYQQNHDILEGRLEEISDPFSLHYGNWMTMDEINRFVQPPVEDQNRVLSWIANYSVTNLENYGDAVKFSAEAEVVCEMFQISDCTSDRWGYSIPVELRDVIEFVEMASRYPKHAPKINRTGSTTDDRLFGREPMVAMYNITATDVNGATFSAGVAEYQNNEGFLNEDVDIQQILNEQPVRNVTHIVGVNTGTDIESELDVQMVSQAADGVQLWYWSSPYWLYSLAVDFLHTEVVPDVVSMSWGWAADQQCTIIDCSHITSHAYVNRVNTEYLKIALRGVTLVASSGDAGAPGRTNQQCDSKRPINPIFPGSSPYVLSVGATYVPMENVTRNYTTPLCLQKGCIAGRDERSVQYNATGWTAGGGFSIYRNTTPHWQAVAVKGYLDSGITLPKEGNFNPKGRAYPDVSAIGHSCPTVIGGYVQAIDGTSCSAPVVAGLISLLNGHLLAKNRSRVGFVNPLLYRMHVECPECFRDITHGYNWCTEGGCCENTTDYGFQAMPGYDPVSGLGTLNVGNILAYLD